MRKNMYHYDDQFHRIYNSGSPRISAYAEYLMPIAKRVFGDDSLLPSYSFWTLYRGPAANLARHKDKNACTYTVDYCVRQIEPWDIYIEGAPYTLQENQAVFFRGEEQEHWREEFPPGNSVELIFFHFVRPDHWYFAE